MRDIFYCHKCGFTGSDEADQHPRCPKCSIPLIHTTYSQETWRAMTDEEKQEVKDRFLADAKTAEPQDTILSDSDNLQRQMAADIRTIKNILVFYFACSIIGALIFLIALSNLL